MKEVTIFAKIYTYEKLSHQRYFVLGVVLILLHTTLFTTDGNLVVLFGKILIWALILSGIVWIVRKIKSRSKNVA